MSLTDNEIAAIRESFRAVAANPDAAGAAFYARLFEVAPQVRPMFKGDIAAQGRKLVAVLAAVAGSVHRLEALMPTVKELALRHTGYGVEPAHYAVVGQVLDETFAALLGEGYPPATRAAWLKAYGVLAEAMIGFAHPESRSAA